VTVVSALELDEREGGGVVALRSAVWNASLMISFKKDLHRCSINFKKN
jgi:hypothetical protein